MTTENSAPSAVQLTRHLARIALTIFLLVFVMSRMLVLLIMSRRIPDLYWHLGGTHVHHLNYGIFLLAGSGAYLLFVRPTQFRLQCAAGIYAAGLALTFDEFGMWLHLGGSYWQRASFDAVVVLAGLLALLAYSPPIRRLKLRHAAIGGVLLVATSLFYGMLANPIQKGGKALEEKLHKIESQSPE